MKSLLVYLSLPLLPFVYALIGLSAKNGAQRVAARFGWTSSVDDNAEGMFPVYCIGGLVLHLGLLLLLKSIGLPWSVSLLSSFLPALCSVRHLHTLLLQLPIRWNLISLSWIVLVSALSVTLLFVSNGMFTLWPSNFSDLAFHISMVSSFVFGENFPPQYPNFPPWPLSYPFYCNLWTASLWWFNPTYEMLGVLFSFQWILLWVLLGWLFYATPFVPFAVLLGGGSVFSLTRYSADLIMQGHPWSVLLSTVWVTQRSAVMGIVVVAAALRIIGIIGVPCFSPLRVKQQERFFFAGVLLSLSLLVHAHLVLLVGAFLSLTLLLYAIPYAITARSEESGKNGWSSLLFFHLGLIPGILFLPLLIGKSSIVHFATGWSGCIACPHLSFSRFIQSLQSWITDAPLQIGLALLLLKTVHVRKEMTAIIFLFVTAQFVMLAVWPWDQIKIFAGLQLLLLCIGANVPGISKLYRTSIVLLVIPGISDLASVVLPLTPHMVFSVAQMEAAARIRSITPPHAVIVGNPVPHNLLGLTGRSIYLGYPGMLWSHGLPYAQRFYFTENIDLLAQCVALDQRTVLTCPDYLLWTAAEQDFWKREYPPDAFEVTDEPILYKMSQQHPQ